MTSSNVNINNNFQYPNLPHSIIWPENPEDTPWFMARLYEQMVQSINQKDNGIFTMAIPGNSSSTATAGAVQIPNLNNFGSYILTISGSGPYIDSNGVQNFWPAEVFILTKSTPNNPGKISSLQSNDGSGPTLNGADYVISNMQVPASTGPYYYFIKHNIDGITGSFNVNIQGTQ